MEGFVPAFKKQNQQRIDALTDRLTSGGCKDYAQYREACGELRALKQSMLYLSEAIKTYMKDDDE